MKLIKAVIAAALGIMLFVPAPFAKAQDMRDGLPFEADPVRGHETATKLCTSCHIIDTAQTGTTQPGVPSFRYIASKPEQSLDKLARTMIHPFPPMIDAHLTNHEIKDISAYIMTLKKRETGKNPE